MLQSQPMPAQPFGEPIDQFRARLGIGPQLKEERLSEPCNCPGCSEEAMHLIQPLYLRVRGA